MAIFASQMEIFRRVRCEVLWSILHCFHSQLEDLYICTFIAIMYSSRNSLSGGDSVVISNVHNSASILHSICIGAISVCGNSGFQWVSVNTVLLSNVSLD